MALRIIFMGTPDFSVPSLKRLAADGHEVCACYSQPPRPAGRRGLELKESPVHQAAVQLGIPVFTPTSLKNADEQAQFAAHEADVAVVIAYGLLLPRPILEAPRLGCFNGHASLLPRWRGAAPIQRAIMAGDAQTGVNIMKMDEGLDTGPVALGFPVSIGPNMSAGELHDVLSETTADLMAKAMHDLEAEKLSLQAQPNEGVTYAHKIEKDEARLDWSRPAGEVHNHIRGLSPFPGAWCEMTISGKPHRVKLLKSEQSGENGTPGAIVADPLTIACGEGAVKLFTVQRAGKQAQDAQTFRNGNKIEKIA